MVSRRRLREAALVAAAILTLLQMPPAVSAAPRGEDRAVRERARGLLQAIPDLWHAIGGIFGREGSSLDPFGNPKPDAVEPTPAAGSSLG
jgi:hypothetical protein